jgi:ribose 5-phosphate isomerase B
MKIALGADHAGWRLKDQLAESLRAAGHEIVDFGTNDAASTDYPDYAGAVAHSIARGEAERGILVCSTGVGMSIAANKVAGIRAALALNADAVRLTREHNDANILALGAKYTSFDEAAQWVGLFLETAFKGGRHERRIEKVRALESGPKED